MPPGSTYVWNLNRIKKLNEQNNNNNKNRLTETDTKGMVAREGEWVAREIGDG